MNNPLTTILFLLQPISILTDFSTEIFRRELPEWPQCPAGSEKTVEEEDNGCFPTIFPGGNTESAKWLDYQNFTKVTSGLYFSSESAKENQTQYFSKRQLNPATNKSTSSLLSPKEDLFSAILRNSGTTTCCKGGGYDQIIRAKYRLFVLSESLKNKGKIFSWPKNFAFNNLDTGTTAENQILQLVHSTFTSDILSDANFVTIARILAKQSKTIKRLNQALLKLQTYVTQALGEQETKSEGDYSANTTNIITEVVEVGNLSDATDRGNHSGSINEQLGDVKRRLSYLEVSRCDHCSIVNATLQWYTFSALLVQTLLSLATLIICLSKRCQKKQYGAVATSTSLILTDRPVSKRQRSRRRRV